MSEVLHLVGVFFSYAVLAIFAQNAIFTRGLGVSRLVQLVGDKRTSSWWFALMLCVTQVLVAPLAYLCGPSPRPAAQPRPAAPGGVPCACIAVVCLFEHAGPASWPKGPRSGQLAPRPAHGRRQQRRAGHGAGGAHPELYAGANPWASALAAAWATCWPCMLVTEARHRLRSRAIPAAFRGLPVTLIYIGVLALAIYGFTGHSVIL